MESNRRELFKSIGVFVASQALPQVFVERSLEKIIEVPKIMDATSYALGPHTFICTTHQWLTACGTSTFFNQTILNSMSLQIPCRGDVLCYEAFEVARKWCATPYCINEEEYQKFKSLYYTYRTRSRG